MTSETLLDIIHYLFPECRSLTLYAAAKSCSEEKLLKLANYLEVWAQSKVPRFNLGNKEPIDVEKL